MILSALCTHHSNFYFMWSCFKPLEMLILTQPFITHTVFPSCSGCSHLVCDLEVEEEIGRLEETMVKQADSEDLRSAGVLSSAVFLQLWLHCDFTCSVIYVPASFSHTRILLLSRSRVSCLACGNTQRALDLPSYAGILGLS